MHPKTLGFSPRPLFRVRLALERGVMEQHELLVLREADIELDDLCTVRQHLL
jgi:hypothetical protein